MYYFYFHILKPIIEIAVLWWVFYQVLVFFEGTRAFLVLRGITYLLIAFLISQIMGFETLNWLLTKIFAISIVAILILFHQELRQGLARLGQSHIFNISLEVSELDAVIEEVTSAVYKLSRQKNGCLVAIERSVKLGTFIESGINLDAKVSSELIQTIFTNYAPLHDGGLIIRGDRIVAASCLFPLTENQNFSKILGTRHRAALGITEHSDSIVIVVSEESGEISVAADGKFIPIVNKERLFNLMRNLLSSEKKNKSK
ncbi:MAG: TIGR00159 family protein [Candidatus Omnitrophica bacterium]|nr:TIGR00159 family protein [Candidatus Omnitrophota bacterium]